MKRVNRILAHRAGKRGGRVQAEVAFGFVLPLQPCLTAAFLYRAGSSLVCQARWIKSVLLLLCFIVVVQSERERGDLSFEPFRWKHKLNAGTSHGNVGILGRIRVLLGSSSP